MLDFTNIISSIEGKKRFVKGRREGGGELVEVYSGAK
jgi:hypothetical protein